MCYHPPPGDLSMRVPRSQRRRSLGTIPSVVLVVLFSLKISSALQLPPGSIGTTDHRTDVPDALDKVNLRNAPSASGEKGRPAEEKETTCLLPPLTTVVSPTIAVQQLQRTESARSEYQRGCAAFRKKNNADAEKHFLKALREYPK